MRSATSSRLEVADGSLPVSVRTQRGLRSPQILHPILLATAMTRSRLTLMSNVLTPQNSLSTIGARHLSRARFLYIFVSPEVHHAEVALAPPCGCPLRWGEHVTPHTYRTYGTFPPALSVPRGHPHSPVHRAQISQRPPSSARHDSTNHHCACAGG